MPTETPTRRHQTYYTSSPVGEAGSYLLGSLTDIFMILLNEVSGRDFCMLVPFVESGFGGRMDFAIGSLGAQKAEAVLS